MSEQGMRQKLIRALRPLDAISVENPAYPGTPDINFVGGWLECKWIRNWPRSKRTPVRIPHFTPQQRVWLLRRWRAGGGAWLMLQRREEWLLFTGQNAQLIGAATYHELRLGSYYWEDGLNEAELIACLAAKKEGHL